MGLPGTLGQCPVCTGQIPRERVLVEYERVDGPAVFAECPDCGEVVHPR